MSTLKTAINPNTEQGCLKVAAVQYNIHWLEQADNLKSLEKIISEHFKINTAVDLLLLPETFSSGFCINNNEAEEPESGGIVLAWLQHMAIQYNCVVAGTVLVKQNEKKVNRFYWAWPNGSVDYYDKRHLFRMGKEQHYVVAGSERKVFEIKGIKILPQVCYDLRFPVWSRNKQDYQLLVNVANWPAARRHVWDTLLEARAMENQAFVIGVNRIGDDGYEVPHSGGTAIYNFIGEPIVSAEDNQQQVIQTVLDFSKLEKFKQDFPAFMDADEFDISD
jgi:predicted amidohydrolase